jgi:ATP-dependent Clp protease ATP-binding subunit ClpB
MRHEKYTQKAREAIAGAQETAAQMGHASLEPAHLLRALITQEDGVVPSVIDRAGADASMILQSVDQALAGLSRASGASLQVGEPGCSGRDPGGRSDCDEHEGRVCLDRASAHGAGFNQ